MGWQPFWPASGVKTYSHQGSLEGANAFIYYRSNGYGVVGLINMGSGTSTNFSQRAHAFLFNRL